LFLICDSVVDHKAKVIEKMIAATEL